jgi:hypothetical protein
VCRSPSLRVKTELISVEIILSASKSILCVCENQKHVLKIYACVSQSYFLCQNHTRVYKNHVNRILITALSIQITLCV